MSKTKVRQKTQIRKSDTYDDTLPAGATLETASPLFYQIDDGAGSPALILAAKLPTAIRFSF